MKKNINKRYIFPAIFSPETGGYNVEFPDLPGAFTCGDDWEESLYMAKDCLETYIYDLDEIPSTSKPENLKPKKGEFIVLVEADLLAFRRKYDNKVIKKTLTLPKWLNDEAVKSKVNFSGVLKKALMKELNIK